MQSILKNCDTPEPDNGDANPNGFWRVDKDKDPELRHTVLTLVAFHDWQLAQTPEESWKECHLHARNLLDASPTFRAASLARESVFLS